jgi:hypothetical protein
MQSPGRFSRQYIRGARHDADFDTMIRKKPGGADRPSTGDRRQVVNGRLAIL